MIKNQNLAGSVVGSGQPPGQNTGNQTTWNGYGSPPGLKQSSPSLPGSLVRPKVAPGIGGGPDTGLKTGGYTGQQLLNTQKQNALAANYGANGNNINNPHPAPTTNPTAVSGASTGPANADLSLPSSITSNPNYMANKAGIDSLLYGPATGLASTVGADRSKIANYQSGALYNLYQTHVQQQNLQDAHTGFMHQSNTNSRGFDNSGGLQYNLGQLAQQHQAALTGLDQSEHQGQIDIANKDITDQKNTVMEKIQNLLSNYSAAQAGVQAPLYEASSGVAGDSAQNAPPIPNPLTQGTNSPSLAANTQVYKSPTYSAGKGVSGSFMVGGKNYFINRWGTIAQVAPNAGMAKIQAPKGFGGW